MDNDRRKIANPSTKKTVFAKTRTAKCIYQKANIIKTNVFPKLLRTTLSILYKGIAYKVFFGPVLKVLTDLRVFSTEPSWAKGFLRSYSISLVTVTKRIVNKAM